MPTKPNEYRKQFATREEADEYTYTLTDRDPRVEVYYEDDYWYVEKIVELEGPERTYEIIIHADIRKDAISDVIHLLDALLDFASSEHHIDYGYNS